MVAQKMSEKSRHRSTYGEIVVIGGTCAGSEVKLVRELPDDPPVPSEPDSDDDEKQIDNVHIEDEDDYSAVTHNACCHEL